MLTVTVIYRLELWSNISCAINCPNSSWKERWSFLAEKSAIMGWYSVGGSLNISALNSALPRGVQAAANSLEINLASLRNWAMVLSAKVSSCTARWSCTCLALEPELATYHKNYPTLLRKEWLPLRVRRGSSLGAVELFETNCCILVFHQMELISELKICFGGTGMVPLVCPFNLYSNYEWDWIESYKSEMGHFDRDRESWAWGWGHFRCPNTKKGWRSELLIYSVMHECEHMQRVS